MDKTEMTDCCWQGHGAAGTHTCWWENKMVQPLWTIVWQFLMKLIYINPKTQRFLSCIYTREMKISSHKKIYISNVLVIITSDRKQIQISTNQWTNKSWCDCTVEYLSVKKGTSYRHTEQHRCISKLYVGRKKPVAKENIV